VTADDVALLRQFSDDPWKFLVSVAILEHWKTLNENLTKDYLDRLFQRFKTAQQVEEEDCWTTVQSYMEEKGLDEQGADKLARIIGRITWDCFDLTKKKPKIKLTVKEVMEACPRATAFWLECRTAVYHQ
jgi:hypothetical protein